MQSEPVRLEWSSYHFHSGKIWSGLTEKLGGPFKTKREAKQCCEWAEVIASQDYTQW